MPRKSLHSLFCLVMLLITSVTVQAQFEYVSPVPGSKMHHPETNIILRNGNMIAPETIKAGNFIVNGSISGLHTVTPILSDDGKTIVLKPDEVFHHGEVVTLSMQDGLRTTAGKKIEGASYSFEIMPTLSQQDQFRLDEARRHVFEQEFGTAGEAQSSDTRDLSDWSGGFPPLSIWANNNPAPGSVFFHNFDFNYLPTAHYCIMGNNADSVYGKFDESKGIGFTINKNGYLTLFNNNLNRFEMLDSNYKLIDKFECGNGYVADVHEFLVYPNGHSYLISYDPQIVDMTVYNPAYNPNAVVIGAVVQELDANHNVVFQWRSWDHYQITDATHIPLSTSEIDYVHANSIELEADGTSFLLSCRHMDEVTKISFTTGDIIWRLGGLHNEFTFIGDQQKFSYQHDVRRLADGHLTVFDNGNYHFPAKSAAKEYILDEVNKTCLLSWKYERGLMGSSSAMGSMQRLPNGNTFICWGLVYNVSFPSITEVTPDGQIVWEMRLDPEFNDGIYRSHRYEWTPCSRPSNSTLQATNITTNSAKLKWMNATNAQSYEVQYKPLNETGWTSKTANKKVVKITGLQPNTTYQWKVRSFCDAPNPPESAFSGKKKFTTLPQKLLTEVAITTMATFPNPATDIVNIQITMPESGLLTLHVFNLLGQQQMSKAIDAEQGENSLSVDVSSWPRGIYLVEANMGNEQKVARLTVQ